MIESVLDFDCLARILRDVEEDKIIFLEIVSQEEEGMEGLGKYVDIFEIKKIAIDRIDSIDSTFVEVDDIEPKKDFSSLTYDMFFFFAVDMDAIDICHDSFAADIVMLLGHL